MDKHWIVPSVAPERHLRSFFLALWWIQNPIHSRHHKSQFRWIWSGDESFASSVLFGRFYLPLFCQLPLLLSSTCRQCTRLRMCLVWWRPLPATFLSFMASSLYYLLVVRADNPAGLSLPWYRILYLLNRSSDDVVHSIECLTVSDLMRRSLHDEPWKNFCIHHRASYRATWLTRSAFQTESNCCANEFILLLCVKREASLLRVVQLFGPLILFIIS